MKTKEGEILNIGDKVIYTYYDRCTDLYKGTVIGFTPQNVKIQYKDLVLLKSPSHLYKL